MGLTWSPFLPYGHHRYQGHVPGVAFSFGSPYGTATLKYFQDHRNAGLERSRTPLSRGGHFPTIFSPNPNLVLSDRSRTRDRWLHAPSYTRFNLDSGRSTDFSRFYQVGSLPPTMGRGGGWGQGRFLTLQSTSICSFRAPEPAGHPVSLARGGRGRAQDSASLTSPRPRAPATCPCSPHCGESWSLWACSHPCLCPKASWPCGPLLNPCLSKRPKLHAHDQPTTHAQRPTRPPPGSRPKSALNRTHLPDTSCSIGL